MILDTFIEGETINLCIPTLEYVRNSDWYSWTNSQYTTMFIPNLGIFPNTKEKQEKYFLEQSERRLLLLISDKKHHILGVISISSIDYKARHGEISLMLKNIFRNNPLEALEAVCLITEHAFLKLGLDKIFAKQHINLMSWSHRMSLCGYRLEGISRQGFVNGKNIGDLMYISCHYEDYLKIIENRGGSLWDSQEKMLQRAKALPKTPIHKKLQEFFKKNEKYYNDIFSL